MLQTVYFPVEPISNTPDRLYIGRLRRIVLNLLPDISDVVHNYTAVTYISFLPDRAVDLLLAEYNPRILRQKLQYCKLRSSQIYISALSFNQMPVKIYGKITEIQFTTFYLWAGPAPVSSPFSANKIRSNISSSPSSSTKTKAFIQFHPYPFKHISSFYYFFSLTGKSP